jgi:hypothetical protein
LPEPLSSRSFPTPDTSGRFHLAAHENNYLSQKNKISSTARAEIKNKSARARRSHFDANPRQSKKVMLFALLLATAVLLVRDPTGKWAGDPLQSWFDHLRNNAGMYCCAKADGHPLDDGEWDIKGNRYRVFVNGVWIVVPDDAVILAPNKFGKAIVWLADQGELPPSDITFSNLIMCFITGSGV